jgi:hypothetical protein
MNKGGEVMRGGLQESTKRAEKTETQIYGKQFPARRAISDR